MIKKVAKIKYLTEIYANAKLIFAGFDELKCDFEKEYEKSLKKVLKTNNETELFLELSKFINKLNDGHTGLTIPKNLRNKHGLLPFKLLQINNNFYIEQVSENCNIPLLSKIIKINNKSISYYVKLAKQHIHSTKGKFYKNNFESFLPFFLRKRNNKLETDNGIFKFDMEKTGNFKFNKIKNLQPNYQKNIIIKDEDFELSTIDEIVYLQINTFNNSKIIEKICEKLEKFNKIRQIIIDLRKNEGGMTANASKIAGYFFKENFSAAQKFTREIIGVDMASASQYALMSKAKIDELVSSKITTFENYINAKKHLDLQNYKIYNDNYKPNNKYFDSEIVILTSHNTISAAEDFCMMFSSNKRATFIGETTYGSTGTPFMFKLYDDCKAKICSVKYKFLDGTDFVNKGVRVNIKASNTLKDIKNGIDNVLNAAIEILKNWKNIEKNIKKP